VQNDSRFDLRILFPRTVELRKLSHSTLQRLSWLAAALSLMAGSVAATYAQSTTPTPAGPASVQTVVFKGSTSSSGWIDFTPLTNFGIYLPVKINGHDAMALLYDGPSNIDKNFVESVGLAAKTVVLQLSNADKFAAERLSCVLRLPNRIGCR
jgi:hypothetical protein